MYKAASPKLIRRRSSNSSCAQLTQYFVAHCPPKNTAIPIGFLYFAQGAKRSASDQLAC